MADGTLIFDTRINSSGFENGKKSITKSCSSMQDAFAKLGTTIAATLGVQQIINFGKTCVNSAKEAGDALLGLKSIVEGQGRDFAQAQEFLNDYISDGLVPLSNAVTAYKNLASRGYDDSQIQAVMLALKDSATYGRQANLTLGDAVQSATEGLKNENSILVDNAGVTKNVAVMWKEYASSIGTSYTNLTKQQKIQAEVNGILEETKFQTGDASTMANSFSGQLSRLSTNFVNFKIAIGDVLINAVQPLIAYFNTALLTMTKFVKMFSKALGLESYSTSAGETNNSSESLDNTASQVSDEIAESTENQNELTKAVEETAKAEERSLAGFDEINKLSENASNSSTTADTVDTANTTGTTSVTSQTIEIKTDTTPVKSAFAELLTQFAEPIKLAFESNKAELVSSVQSAVTNIKELILSIGQSFMAVWTNGTGELYISNILVLLSDVFYIIGDIAQAFKTAWNDDGTGQALIQSYFDRWNALLELIHIFADDFRAVWNNDTGETVCSNILQIITNINNTVTNLRKNFAVAWQENNTGRAILQSIFNIFNIILGTVRNITKHTAEWSETLDFSPLLKSIQGLLEELEPLTENIGAGFEWLFENVLTPLASWTIEDVLPAFLDVLAGAISLVNSVIEVFKPLAEWLWDTFLEPIAKWTGGIIVSVLKSLAGALTGISDWITEHQEGVTQFLKLAGIGAAILGVSSAVQKLASGFSLISTVISLVSGAASFLAPIISSLTSVIGLLTNPITLVIAVGMLLIAHWDEVKEVAINCWNNITEKFENAVTFIKDIFSGIGEWFSKRWEEIKAVFSVVGNWFKEQFQQAWDNITVIFSVLGSWFSKRWEDVKSALAFVDSWLGDKFQQAWDNITAVFSVLGSWFSNRWEEVKAVFSVVGSWFREQFQQAWDNITAVFSILGGWFSNRWEDVKSALAFVNSWLGDKFQQAWNNITSVFSVLGGWFSNRWEDVKSAFSKVGSWFTDIFQSAYDGITGIFSNIGGWFGGIWEDVKDGAKWGVNGIVDIINGLIGKAEDAVNFIIDCINSLHFDIPDFVPGIGGTSVGFNIPYVNLPEVPHLATGTVIPANYGEFLAVLGDNKKEREFVSPESALKTAFAEVLSQFSGNQGDIVINLSMFPNERAFQQYIVKANKNIQSRGGKAF